ncbi:SPFH domain-containing protein [uncultured Arthrobacter sp.]|uniref:SPFH domain-containing protein n=1 Tax=uncultured Arthrobacter sp. TaxID=114050 RepID=UPI002608A0F8|nr:SPFH domain-containing protein [uncultured Arthrobacter sp.]
MGLIKAAMGAIGSTSADQWKDFLTVPASIPPTAALFPAVRSGANANRNSNTRGSQAVVTNGSKIVVPEGYGLLLFQDGELTAATDVPGGYIWNSDELDSQSFFVSDDQFATLVIQSWERFKFGGRPGSQQLALFVALKELPNNKFGTQSPVYWDDAYFNAQVGVLTYGTYSMNIVDPILFAKRFVPAIYLQAQGVFDFTDATNDAATQLFSEVVGSLSAAFSSYTNHPQRGNRITAIQRDSIGFAEHLSVAVESAYQWRTTRGLAISNVSIMGIRYDESTQELLKSVQRADALGGARGHANLQASVAAGLETAGGESGANGILGMGLAAGALNIPWAMQKVETPETPPAGALQETPDLVTKLEGLKRALDAGLIDQAEFDAAKAKALGLS